MKTEGVCGELEEVREEGGRVRAELQRQEERAREMEGELREVRENLEEKDRLLKKALEVHVHTCA